MVLELPVILGTVREGRKSEHVARYVHERLSRRPDVHSNFIDPREWDLQNLVMREFEMPNRPPRVAEFTQIIQKADGFLVVTPEYNYGLPGALKNLLDITFKPWNRKPFAMVGCGGVSGGLRALDQLRQVVAGLGAISVPSHVPVPSVGTAFGAGGPVADVEAWNKRFDGLFDELEWYAKALKGPREARAASR